MILSLLISAVMALSSPTAGTAAVDSDKEHAQPSHGSVRAAELHYPRIPREYWSQRMDMCKALGMNTICMYVFWNAHEPRPGEFDFTGNLDIAAFVRMADAKGLKVILRPGPYVCAEWDMGGLPWWLLRREGMTLRTADEYFLERVRLFEQEVAGQLAPLTADKGGPIIMVQVENEYGSYGADKPYITAIRDILRNVGFNNVQLFQCDWSSNFQVNGLDDLMWTLNFGTGADVMAEFAPLKAVRPDAQLMCSEYWSGWYDKWGQPHETRPAEAMVNGIETMLRNGISFSLYMTHGGTSFGHWSGANDPGYLPLTTSYDYDAPITEWGAPRDKYHMLRDVMARYTSTPLPDIPDTIPLVSLPEITMTGYAPLTAASDTTANSPRPLTLEAMNRGYGQLIYRATLPGPLAPGSVIMADEVHDYAVVRTDGKTVGVMDRRADTRQVTLSGGADAGVVLELIVDATGRINFGRRINDRKGITKGVYAISAGDTTELTGWQVEVLTDDYELMGHRVLERAIPTAGFSATEELGAARYPRGFYTATFTYDGAGDTFLDVSAFGKGQVWVNGHPLGRFWETGPQQALYLPGVWLHPGENQIIMLDILGPRALTTRGLPRPRYFIRELPGEQM